MAAIRHVFSNAIPDSTNTNIVRPIDWNSGHNLSQTISGNTAGASTWSGTNLILEGGNNVTLSLAGDTLRIDGGAGGAGGIAAAAGTQTATSGTVVFADSNGLVFGMSGSSQITGSYTVPVVPPETPFGISAGTQSVSTGTLVFSDSNNVSFTMSGSSRIVASASFPAQTVQTSNIVVPSAGTQTATSGTVVWSNSNNLAFGMSGSSRITASAALSMFAVSNTTQSTSGSANISALSFGGAGAVSVGVTGGSVVVSAPNTIAQTVQTQNVVVPSAGTQTATSGTVVWSNSNNLAFGMSGSSRVTASAALSMFAVSNTTQSTSGSANISALSFGGAGAVSVGVTGGSVVVSAPNTIAQTNQQMTLFATGNTTQSSTGTTNASSIIFAGSGIASVGITGGSIVISVPAGGGAAGTNTLGISNLGNTSGTSGVITGSNLQFVLAGGNNITLSQSINGSSATVTISGPNTAAQFSGGNSNLGNTAGDTGVVTGRLVLVGSNNITLSGSTNGGSQTISIIGGAGGAGFSAGLSTIGQTSGQTGVTGTRLVFAAFGGIGLSQATDANGGTIQMFPPTQSVSFSGNTSNNSTGTYQNAHIISAIGNLTAFVSSDTLKFSVAPQTTQAGSITFTGNTAANSTLTFAGPVTFNASTNITIWGSNGSVVFSGPAAGGGGNQTFVFQTSIGHNSGDTFSTGSWVLLGGNNITLNGDSFGTQKVIIDGPDMLSVGLSNLGNTQGNTGMESSQVVFVGTNNITLSQSTNANGATIRISGQPAFSAGVSTGGGTSGATGITGTRLVFAGADGITLSQSTDANGGTITVEGPQRTVFHYIPYDALVSYQNNTLMRNPNIFYMAPNNVVVGSRVDVPVAIALSSSSNSSHAGVISGWIALYTRNGSTLSLASSGSTFFQWTNTSNNSMTNVSGMRLLTLPLAFTMTPGEYWGFQMFRTSSTNANWFTANQVMVGATNVTANLIGVLNQGSANNNRFGWANMAVYSNSTVAVPASIGFTQMSQMNVLPYIVFMNSTF